MIVRKDYIHMDCIIDITVKAAQSNTPEIHCTIIVQSVRQIYVDILPYFDIYSQVSKFKKKL